MKILRQIALLLSLLCIVQATPMWAGDLLPDIPRARQTWFHSWKQHGSSSEGRPIEALQIGRGPFRTLVLGSLHGSEPMAVEMTARLATHLGTTPDHWHKINVLIVRTPNPDGHANGSNWNARGVDLNHNFPRSMTDNTPRDDRAGASDCSETETRCIRMLLNSYRPQRIVHIKSTPNAFGWALCSRQARAVSSYLGKFRNLRVGQWEQHRVAGSIEDYSAGVLNLEMVTLAVPNGPNQTVVWRDYRNQLLAAAAYVDPNWRTMPRQVHSAGRGLIPSKSVSRERNEFGRYGRFSRRQPLSPFWRSSQRRKLSLPIQIWPSDTKSSR